MVLALLLLCLHSYSNASPVRNAKTDSMPARLQDVGSVDAIIGSLYDVISGPANEKRNWDRMRTLFIPEAQMVPTAKRADGTVAKRVLSVEDYISASGPVLEKNGFFEKEIGHKLSLYGNIAHVFSAYESRHGAGDAQPFMRGINSIQLFNDGKRWWITHISWQSETPDNPLPKW